MRLTVPMTMMEFFRKSEGKWYTERSVHHFDVVADESGKSIPDCPAADDPVFPVWPEINFREPAERYPSGICRAV